MTQLHIEAHIYIRILVTQLHIEAHILHQDPNDLTPHRGSHTYYIQTLMTQPCLKAHIYIRILMIQLRIEAHILHQNLDYTTLLNKRFTIFFP